MSAIEETWRSGRTSSYESTILNPRKKDETEQYSKLPQLATFTNLHATMFAIVMEDAIMEIRILHGCNNELRIAKLMSEMEHLLKIKFGIKRTATKDELDLKGNDHKNLECHQYKLNKLFADRTYIEDVFTNSLLDLSQQIGFDTMSKQNNEINKRVEHFHFVVKEVANNKNMRRDLWKKRRTQRNHIKSVIYDADAAIDSLNNQLEDAVLVAKTQSRYVDNWQNARTEQHILDISNKENVPESAIKYYRQAAERETRVHGEVETLSNVLINETLTKIEEWMDKYDKDMEALDLKIQIKKNDYQNTKDKRIMLEKTYAKHEQLMKEWIKFKEDREKARIYVETMTNAAIAVQAWWRGMLVRRMLGPYKVSKKKQKKK